MRYYVRVGTMKLNFDVEYDYPDAIVGFVHGIMQILQVPAVITIEVRR